MRGTRAAPTGRRRAASLPANAARDSSVFVFLTVYCFEVFREGG
jgi:hypothetical protein